MPVLDLLQACAGKHLFADRYLSLLFALPPHRLLVKKVSTKPAIMPCCPFSHESLRWPSNIEADPHYRPHIIGSPIVIRAASEDATLIVSFTSELLSS